MRAAITLRSLLVPALACSTLACAGTDARDAVAEVTFYGSAESPIASGVVIPPGRAWVWVSGTGPRVIDTNAPPGSPRRYGDTATQARGVLQDIANQLIARNLTMRDVVYIRAYLVPDREKQGRLDTAGWNEAYREVFGTAETPTKTARSTVGVAALVNPDWLVEIEAFAVYP